MKSVLISIQPKWCELIANGKKTVEVRKTRPKIETPFKVYIYCTLQGSNEFFQSLKNRLGEYEALSKWNREKWGLKKGKVIGEFVCDFLYEFTEENQEWCGPSFDTIRLTPKELSDYANGKALYGWHISNLVIHDKSKELGEFYSKCDEGCEDCDFWKSVRVNADEYDMECSSSIYGHRTLKRPPQSWCYVESEVEGE